MGKFWNFLKSKTKSKTCLFYIILANVLIFIYSYIACDPVFYTLGKEFARNIAMLLFSLEYIIVAYFLTKPSFTFESFKKDDGNQVGKTRKSTNELMNEFSFTMISKKVALFMLSTVLPALFFAYYIVIYSFNFNISIDFILSWFIVIFTILEIALFSIGKVEYFLYSIFFAQIIFFINFTINYEPYLPRILNIPHSWSIVLWLIFLYFLMMIFFVSVLKIKCSIIIFNNSVSIRKENIKKRTEELAKTLREILGEKNEISKSIGCYDLNSGESDFKRILDYLDNTTNCLNGKNFEEKKKNILKAKNQLDSIDYFEEENAHIYKFHIGILVCLISSISVINLVKDSNKIKLLEEMDAIGIITEIEFTIILTIILGSIYYIYFAYKYLVIYHNMVDLKNKKYLIKLSLDNILIDIDEVQNNQNMRISDKFTT